MLVVRECGFCKGTDDALLSRRLDNERTLLLTKWFHCVKLPNHVLEADHPFRNLFEGEHPPHLFVCRADGSGVVSMDGQQSQSDLWRAMEELIGLEYEESVKTSVKGLLRCLDGYDSIDSREREIRQRLEATLDEDGPDSPKVRKLQKKLEKLAAERAEIAEREVELLDLGLREPQPVDSAKSGG